MVKKIFLIFVVIVILSFNLKGEIQANVYGKIIDKDTKEPLKNIYIAFENLFKHNNKISTVTNDKGEFSFERIPTETLLKLRIYILYRPENEQTLQYFEHFINKDIFIKKGTNLYLKPILISKGVKVSGNISLWDGTPIKNSLVKIEPYSLPKEDYLLSGGRSDETGKYTTMPLPQNVELVFIATNLKSHNEKIVYCSTSKLFKITSGIDLNSFNITIPNIQTKISGRVVDKNNIPIENQKIRITHSLGSLERSDVVKTDLNGEFIFMHIPTGEFVLDIPYKSEGSIKFFETREINIIDNQSLSFNIQLDQIGFNYQISSSKYSQ